MLRLLGSTCRVQSGLRDGRSISSSTEDDIAKVVKHYLPSAELASVHTPAERVEVYGRPSLCESIKTIEERQVAHKLSGLFAIEKTRCRHGFPRAYVVSVQSKMCYGWAP